MTAVLGRLNEPAREPFRPDEPVLQQHPIQAGAAVPGFADDVWDLSAATTAMNIPPYAKVIKFARFPTPTWTAIARVILIAQLNPNHHAVRAAGVHRSSVRGTNIRTVVDLARVLGDLAEWAKEHAAAPVDSWTRGTCVPFVDAQRAGATPSEQTRLKRAGALRALHLYRDLLPGGGLLTDPFYGQALPKAIGYRQADACTGPLVAKDLFWPLLRAAWAYVDTFSDDILRARDEWELLQARTPVRRATAAVLEAWQRDASAVVPLHTTAGFWPADEPNWRLLSLQLQIPEYSLGQGSSGPVKAAQAHASALVRNGRTILGGLAEPLAQVERADSSSGPWRNGLDARSLKTELTALRAAAYIFIAAISGMRDSEIQELERGCLEHGHAGPVLRSRRWKHTDGRATTWAVIDPVARAIEVLERLSRHETHLFAPSFKRAGSTRTAGIDANNDIEVFIRHVNEIAATAGLDPIPPGTVTTHAFRHTFAVIAADEPFAEIAVGWQLKHAANRIMTTQAHLDREGTGWDKDIATEQTRSAIDALYESFASYLDGGTIAGGGGARRAAFFDGIAGEVADRFPGQTGDDEVIKPFLRTAAKNYYPGTLNDCAFDASLARCLTGAAGDNATPVLSACQPGRCPNATIEEKHRPVWVAGRGRLADLLARKDLSEPKRALLDAELAEVDRTIATMKERPIDAE
jgi:hypothetical protein